MRNKDFEDLMEVILKIKNKKELENFLLGILTPKEMMEIPNRLKIVKLIKKGIAHQDIANRLHVGVATVTRGSHEIQKGHFKYV
jgi:TrpR family transcriptional regulator, trp operon repressor